MTPHDLIRDFHKQSSPEDKKIIENVYTLLQITVKGVNDNGKSEATA